MQELFRCVPFFVVSPIADGVFPLQWVFHSPFRGCVHGRGEKPFKKVPGKPQALMWNLGLDGKSCFYSLKWTLTLT